MWKAGLSGILPPYTVSLFTMSFERTQSGPEKITIAEVLRALAAVTKDQELILDLAFGDAGLSLQVVTTNTRFIEDHMDSVTRKKLIEAIKKYNLTYAVSSDDERRKNAKAVVTLYDS